MPDVAEQPARASDGGGPDPRATQVAATASDPTVRQLQKARKRLWVLRVVIVIGVLVLTAGHWALFAWLTLYGLPEHFFQRYETQVADGKLAFHVSCLMVLGPALIALWLLIAKLLWRRLGLQFADDSAPEAGVGRMRRVLLRISNALFWVLVAFFAVNAVIAPWWTRRENEKIRALAQAERKRWHPQISMQYSRIRLPEVMPGKEMVIGDLVGTFPVEMSWRSGDYPVLEGGGLRVTGGNASSMDLSFPPGRAKDYYLSHLYYRIDNPVKLLELICTLDETSLDAPKSRLGITGALMMWVERDIFLASHGHRIRSFVTADGLRVFADEMHSRGQEPAWFSACVAEGEGARSKVYLVSIRPSKNTDPAPAVAPSQEAWLERALSIAASLRHRRPADADEKPAPVKPKRLPVKPLPPIEPRD